MGYLLTAGKNVIIPHLAVGVYDILLVGEGFYEVYRRVLGYSMAY